MLSLAILAILVGSILCSLAWVCMDPDILDDITELIKEERVKRLSRKAIRNDTYMLKFIKKMIHAEKMNKERYLEADDYIAAFLSALKESRTYDDFYAYQKDCIDRIDRMKNVIRNSYQDDTYRKTAGLVLSCLSIVETNLLTGSFDSGWEEEINRYLHNCLYVSAGNHGDQDEPEKWVKKIRKKEIRPEEQQRMVYR